ncbi:MAG TPA: cysteine desulfurase family protein [Bacteroidales bacterium]|nr:cysteine desulfurase family protein [Bacteroidales bacterium]HPS17741.1 cysteine desulfurase family protein [Bacteroidales bacterium]
MIYLDNAATTPLDKEVIDEMTRVMQKHFGNPSSVHTLGREARVIIEDSRNMVAKLLNVSPSSIYFTSCGTESINMVFRSCVNDLGVRNIITSPIEHHAVLHAAENYRKENKCEISFVNIDKKGNINLNHLEELLKGKEKSLVCLMHVNNEIGNILPIKDVANICNSNNALFLCDTVQSMGKIVNDLRNINVDFAVCSAHKFHGPKGIGFLYLREGVKLQPMLHGGGQERNMRSGTENIYGIAGLAKAFEVAHRNLDKNISQIKSLKANMVQLLKKNIPDVAFNGESEENGIYHILNVVFPRTKKSDMLLYNLDIEGIAASGGSACNSGSISASHVLREIKSPEDRTSIRFSFSKYNTVEEIEKTIEILKKIL